MEKGTPEKGLMEIPYLFYANPISFPNWKYENRFGVGLDIDRAWYKEKPIWRYKVLKGSYKDCILEIERDKARQVVVRNAIPSGSCHDLLPVEVMKMEKPIIEIKKVEQIIDTSNQQKLI